MLLQSKWSCRVNTGLICTGARLGRMSPNIAVVVHRFRQRQDGWGSQTATLKVIIQTICEIYPAYGPKVAAGLILPVSNICVFMYQLAKLRGRLTHKDRSDHRCAFWTDPRETGHFCLIRDNLSSCFSVLMTTFRDVFFLK